MRKKGYMVLIILCISLLGSTVQSKAEQYSVKVKIPDFEVRLNGQRIENQDREYPLLVYNNITYVPMTWYDSRFLGLEANWSRGEGLTIKKSLVTSSYIPYKSDYMNTTTYTAEVISSTINVNGKSIDNSKEEYPLLTFRNVTYFPLTWRFAHDEFGWEYYWDSIEGLSINSHNPQLGTVKLPEYAGENDIALFKGYYYFVETSDTMNYIYRTPMNQLSKKEEIYSYDITLTTDTPKNISFQIRDNTLFFKYQIGRGVMGSIKYVKVSDNGKAEKVLYKNNYGDFRDTQYGTLFINYFNPEPPNGSLYLQQEDNLKSIGNPDLMMHANHIVRDGTTATYVVDDNVYVLCSPNSVSYPYNIYRINLKNNNTEKVVNSNISWFQVINNKLYYIKEEDKKLYSSDLDGTDEIKLSEHSVAWFDIIDENIFYTSKIKDYQFKLYKLSTKGEDLLIWDGPVTSVKIVKDMIVCKLYENSGLGAVVFNRSGNLLLKITDPISYIFTSDDAIIVLDSKDSLITKITSMRINESE